MRLFHSISDKIKDFYQDPGAFSQPQTVNLEKKFSRYSFLEYCSPTEKAKIQKLFELNITRSNGQVLSVRELLREREFHEEDVALLKDIGFHHRYLNSPEVGIQ